MKYNLIMDFKWGMTHEQCAAIVNAMEFVSPYFPLAGDIDFIQTVAEAPITAKQSLSPRFYTMRSHYNNIVADRLRRLVVERLGKTGILQLDRVNIYFPDESVRMTMFAGTQTRLYRWDRPVDVIIINHEWRALPVALQSTLAHELLHLHPIFNVDLANLCINNQSESHCPDDTCLMSEEDNEQKTLLLCDVCIERLHRANKSLWTRRREIPMYMNKKRR
jgi:hypothetical protein